MPSRNAPPTVLHVVAVEYSARTLLVPQMAHQQAAGLDVRLACAREGMEFSAALTPFRPIDVPLTRKMEPRRMLKGAWAMRRVIAELQPAIVHLHGSSTAAIVRALPRWALGEARIVFTVHGFPFQWDRLQDPRSRGLELLECTLARRTDLILFQSREDLEGATERRYRSRLRFLGNGVQDLWFDIPEPSNHEGPIRLLFTGRLTRVKGILELLHAVKAVPDVTLTVAGGRLDSERDDIGSEVGEVSRDPRLRDRVKLLGTVPPEQMPSVMADCDAFVLPTYHNEGLPRSLLEAMAAGRVCVATTVRGCREAVRDGMNGFLVPPRDEAALVDALWRISQLSASERRSLGSTARDDASRNFRESSVLERLDAAYAELGVIGSL